ncbi:hypothetical protein [Kaistia sp. MMO-174]|uniref:hypothetical protein n=1 Tax=Kaistia sp. MMO-174 TaxID=3081256 RepID=UPI003016A2A4
MGLFDKGMIVNMGMVERWQIEAALSKLPSRFKSYTDLASLLRREGVAEEAIHRAADRVLQRLRKAGAVSYSKGWWEKAALREDPTQ